MTESRGSIPAGTDGPGEIDYSQPFRDAEALPRDTIPVRSLRESDLWRLAKIDHRHTGRERTRYYERKVAESLNESGVRVSLVAELDEHVVGFIMARVDFGEFGHVDPEAVIDTIGVDPVYSHRRVASALVSQLLQNLAALRVERVRTEVDWNHFGLLAFLERCGFRPAQRLVFRRALD